MASRAGCWTAATPCAMPRVARCVAGGIPVDITWSRTGRLTLSTGEHAAHRPLLEQAAEHLLAARQALAHLPEPDLKARGQMRC